MPSLTYDEMPGRPDLDIVLMPRVTLAVFGGEIDLAVKAEIESKLNAALAVRAPVLVDLCSCTFMDSTGIYALINAKRAAKKAEIKFAVACVPDGAPSAVLKLLLPDYLDVYPDRASGLEALASS